MFVLQFLKSLGNRLKIGRISFMEFGDQHFKGIREIGHPFHRLSQFLEVVDLIDQLLGRGQKFMDRWIQKAYGDRITLHTTENFLEIISLKGKKTIPGFLPLFYCIYKDHLLYDGQPLRLVEHPFRSA